MPKVSSVTYLTGLLEDDLDLADVTEVGDDNVDVVRTLEGLVVIADFRSGTMFSGSAVFSASLDSFLDFLDFFFFFFSFFGFLLFFLCFLDDDVLEAVSSSSAFVLVSSSDISLAFLEDEEILLEDLEED